VGLQVSYLVTITHHGPDAATGVELAFQLTNGFDFQAVDGNCLMAAPRVYPSIAVDEPVTYIANLCISRCYRTKASEPSSHRYPRRPQTAI